MGIPINSPLGQRILELAGEKPAPLAPVEERVSEKDFMEAVKAEAKRQGWKVYHVFDSRKSEAGFPDLVLVRDRVIFAELKAEDGKTTADQDNWLDALRAGGAIVYLWKPSSWKEIFEVLQWGEPTKQDSSAVPLNVPTPD